MPHAHSHHHTDQSDVRLVIAIALNLLLSIVEVLAGVLSGSLALAADGVHNFQDCASLAVALVARRIARRPSDQQRTFGYRRAEVIGALVNLTALAMIGFYLAYEAIHRLFQPREINGWVVVVVAMTALAVNIGTAALLFAVSHKNMNLRAAFLHNVGDALSSAGVILTGVAVLTLGVFWLDAVVTLAIAGYILWQSCPMIARSIHILLESVPADIVLDELISDLHTIEGVVDVHHVHVWEMDEEHRALEAHVVVSAERQPDWTEIKGAIKALLRERFAIHHSTLELETTEENACDECTPGRAHVSET